MYQGKKVNKHWTQIAEEEALFHKMINEAREAQAQAEANSAAPGGWPQENKGYFKPDVTTLAFSISPSATGSAPYTVYLNPTNGCSNDVVRFCNWTYNFSDGTSATGPTATHTFDTGSFSVSVTASALYGGNSNQTSLPLTASLPVYLANFTSSVQTGSVPLTVTFTNLTTINQYTGSFNNVSYLWTFGSASATSTVQNPTVTYYQTGSYTVRLSLTGSYGMMSSKIKFAVSAST